jgi:hypothetical protein
MKNEINWEFLKKISDSIQRVFFKGKVLLSVCLSRLVFGGSTELADFHRNRWLSERGSEPRKEVLISGPAQRGTKLKSRFRLMSRGN